MPDIWFTSDTHYGHANIIKYDQRPFANVEEHDDILMERFNALVRPGDLVYHLGDFAFYRKVEEVEAVLSRLNGQLHHIFGNHDRNPVRRAKGWASQQAYREIKADIGEDRRRKIVLFHYPLLTWNGAHHGSWMLHGHCHGSLLAPKTTRLDVGVPCWHYEPINLDTVKAWMTKREYRVVDQHKPRGKPAKDDLSVCEGSRKEEDGGAGGAE